MMYLPGMCCHISYKEIEDIIFYSICLYVCLSGCNVKYVYTFAEFLLSVPVKKFIVIL